MKKLIFGVLAVTALFFIGGCSAGDSFTEEEATAKAQEVYQELAAQGFNFESGPCISNNLFGDEAGSWVVDVVHEPRDASDDLPENQCTRYRAGDAKHFVELDLEGNVVRVH